MNVRRVAGWILVALGAAGTLLSLGLLAASVGSFSWRSLVFLLVGLLVSLALPLALLVVGWRLAHPAAEEARPDAARPPRPRPAPVAPVSDADVADIPEPVTACPDCGYLSIRMPGIQDGLWPGGGETGARMVCPRCNWQGLPVRFETRADYAQFLRELAG